MKVVVKGVGCVRVMFVLVRYLCEFCIIMWVILVYNLVKVFFVW